MHWAAGVFVEVSAALSSVQSLLSAQSNFVFFAGNATFALPFLCESCSRMSSSSHREE
jgi:hypothetical protein